MGFRNDSYATIWSVEPVSDRYTKARISISRKDKQTGEYETEFSGFVNFLGTAAANKAASLKERDRIKLGEVDVRSKYDKEKNATYYSFNVFSFDIAGGGGYSSGYSQQSSPQPQVDDGDIDYGMMPW